MTPTPQENVQPEVLKQKDGDRIVISGMAGIYPQSSNVKELSEVLYNKVNPVTQKDVRFKYYNPEVVQYTGSIPDLNRFDAQFFKVHYRLANCMDPMAKKILEQAYHAIYDAGVNPNDLSGKKVGVYIGSCFSEAEKACFYEASTKSGFGIAGANKAMFANRISYWLNAKGPSMSIDEACCSSTAALEQAYLALSRDECESAIVGGSFLSLHPQSALHFGRIIKLCPDGKTKSFQEDADGCAKSEVINALFLQKAKDALRVYAEVLYAKTEYTCLQKTETGPKYGFYRDLCYSTDFIRRFYDEVGISPTAVEYVEAFGSAVPESDKGELQTIEEVFCENRHDPLLIGSVMSNIGYGEASSGISAITKVLLGYHCGALAANLHCEKPRKDISALQDGRMRIVTEHQPFGRTYVGVNGLSFTGTNSHVLLHGRFKPKDLKQYKTTVPYLVTASGRHEEAVKYIMEVLKSNPIDPEQLALLHNIHRKNISGHMARGFAIIQTDSEQNTTSLCEKFDYFDDLRRPLWFVYSGMGSQWAGMGEQLMCIPIFAAAIERCRKVLEPKGLDIVNIITKNDESIFNNILNSFVGIAAVQIGLTDILHELGLKPDGIIGHSVGELGCAYADGCLTAEEMILSAYYRGLVSIETEFIHGSMAAVGVGYEKISKMCPAEIEVACHNGPDSSTISGPSDVMREFVATLTSKGIFAKEVPCSNIAYHSSYIASAGHGLRKYLQETIKTPKLRSERWFSTSVPIDKWSEPHAQRCSAEYLTNNLLNPVLFEETSRLLPNNAVLVEIAPHGLLQAILKRSMPPNCKNITLTRRKHPNNTILLLEAIGKLYMEGYNTNIQVLYPKVKMPVSTGTPFLSHLVKWAHEEKWPLPVYRSARRKVASTCDFVIALHDKEHAFLRGHQIRGTTLYPFAASLTLVWDVLAMLLETKRKQLSVELKNIQLYSQPVLHDRLQLKLSVTINRGTGWFEILDGISKVATGFIKPLHENELKRMDNDLDKQMHFSAADIYQLLRERDYFYSGEFKSIACSDESHSDGMLVWDDNWVTLLDGMLQLNMIRQPHHTLSVPSDIRRIIIDVQTHRRLTSQFKTSDSKLLVRAKLSDVMDSTRCGGVIIESIKFQYLPLYTENKMALKSLKFVSNFESGLNVSSSLHVYCQIVAENVYKNTLNVVGIRKQTKKGSVFNEINNIFKNLYGININYKETKIDSEMEIENYEFGSVDLILVQGLSTYKNACPILDAVLQKDTFIVSEEDSSCPDTTWLSSMCRVLCVHSSPDHHLQLKLIRWGPVSARTVTTTVSVRKETDINFLTSVRNNLSTYHQLIVITSYPSPPGLKELISSWRKESVCNRINLVTVKDTSVDNLQEIFCNIDLVLNHVINGKLGGEYYLPLKENITKNQNVTLQTLRLGDYDSLKWVNAPELTGAGITVNVHYAGINSSDTKQASSFQFFKRNLGNSYGTDFSGITESGKRVMGIVRTGALSTQVRAQPELLWPVPPYWSLKDAATVPLAYMQAFYILAIKTNLPRGRTVLVHGGAGALGQAIISIALALDCKVFTTVSDIRKKNFLQKMFPALKAPPAAGEAREAQCGTPGSNRRKGPDLPTKPHGVPLPPLPSQHVTVGQYHFKSVIDEITRLYMEGYNTNIQVLYPKVKMPVSTGTPFLSHLVKWAHEEKWPLPVYRSARRKVASTCDFVIALHDKEHAFLRGHQIRGTTLYPFAASLTLVWDVLAMLLETKRKQLSVELKNIQLYSQPVLHDRLQLKLSVTINRGTGWFEILDGISKVATGFIKPLHENELKRMDNDLDKQMHFSAADIYQLLRERDYFYSGEFKSIACSDESHSDGMLVWDDNWVTLLDGMLQLNMIRQPHHTLSVPSDIRRIIIDVQTHRRLTSQFKTSDSKLLVRAKLSDVMDSTRCGGVIIESIKFQYLPLYTENKMALKSLKFVSNFESGLNVSSSLHVYCQIVAENVYKNTLNVVGIRKQTKKGSVFNEINNIFKNLYGININYKETKIDSEMEIENYEFGSVDLILVQGLSTYKNACPILDAVLQKDTFIVSEEDSSCPDTTWLSSMCRVLCVHSSPDHHLQLKLIRWGPVSARTVTTTVSVRKETDINFLTSVRNNLSTYHQLIVITSYPSPPGLKELISSWRKESVCNRINLVTVKDTSVDNLQEIFCNIDLVLNHVINGKLGGEYYLPLKENITKNQNVTLQTLRLGDYDSLKWVNAPELTGAGITVNVHYAGINSSDTKQASSFQFFKRNLGNSYGTDFSGITESGKRVMGIVRTGALSTQVRAQPELLWPVPPYWSLKDAATVPLAYMQAFYILAIKTNLPRGRTVLVHGGAGALGQAIISIALALDCKVFTTVSDIRKKNFLQKMFPALKADHIGCSRDGTFRQMIETVSKSKNCDVVISCVKGNLKDESLKLTNAEGFFFDISQLQNRDDYNFGMNMLSKERSYFSLDLFSIFEDKYIENLKAIHTMVSEGIVLGYVRPLSRVTYAPHDVPRAFRLLAASSHRGRVLIHMKDTTIAAENRLSCNPNRSHLIICSETTFGIQFAERLVTRGAKQVYLHVPTHSSYLQQKSGSCRRIGINVVVTSESLHNQEAVDSLLTNVLSVGPLEGVYIVVAENNTDIDLTVISNLDAQTRNLCPDLSFFAVISFGENLIGESVCLDRLNHQLPATVLKLFKVDELHGSAVNWRSAVDAAEHALQSTHGMVIAHGPTETPSLLKQVAALADINIPGKAAEDLSLGELGIQHYKLEPLSSFLQIHYNLALNEEQIQLLTIKKLLETEKKISDFSCVNVKGLSTFFNYIDSDELLATTEIIYLPTLVTSTSMRDDEFEPNQINMCIVPGMEGHHERFRLLCERLKLPALVLQPGLDHQQETVRETAERFAKILLNKTGLKDTFYLLGYESGIFIALEIATILEDHGLIGKVFLVGCTPEELKDEIKEQLSIYEDERQLEEGLLRHMYMLMAGGDTIELENALQNLSTWSQKIEACVRILLCRVSQSAQYTRSLIECALTRINQLRHYDLKSPQLNSQVILLHAAMGHEPQPDTVLHRISKQPLIVYERDSSLADITKDLQCATIVNENLSPEILENYATKNICDTYLLGACLFMAVDT